MNVLCYLDLVGIVFSLVGVAFVVEPYTEIDALFIGTIIIGFLMWGLHSRSLGRWNLPVKFSSHTPRLAFWSGSILWGILASMVTFVIIMEGVWESILPMATFITAWRVCSVYTLGLFGVTNDGGRAMVGRFAS